MTQAVAEIGSNPTDAETSRIASAGRQWAESVRNGLIEDGRVACGGWPGTVSEARARTQCAPETPPSERERLVRLLYDSAREFWLSHRDPLVQEPRAKLTDSPTGEST
jgi:hypothetical protein